MTDFALDRRAFAAAAFMAGAAGAASPARAAAADLNDPAANLDAYIRMRGDLSGKVTLERVEARLYGVVEKQLPKPLFAAIGIQASRFRKIEEGYAFKFKYFSLPVDMTTGARLSVFDNPYTGKKNDIPARLPDTPEIQLTTQGWRMPGRPVDPATQNNPGVIRPWRRIEDRLLLTDTLISPPNFERHPAFQVYAYAADYRQATNPRRSGVPSTFAGAGMEHWRAWMDIQEPEGSLCVHTYGQKVSGPDAFPAWLVEAALAQDKSIFDFGDA